MSISEKFMTQHENYMEANPRHYGGLPLCLVEIAAKTSINRINKMYDEIIEICKYMHQKPEAVELAPKALSMCDLFFKEVADNNLLFDQNYNRIPSSIFASSVIIVELNLVVREFKEALIEISQ